MKKILAKLVPLAYGTFLNILVIFNPKKAAKTAFNIFAKVRKGKIKDFQKPFLDAVKLPMETIGDHQIQSYEWKGKKGPILLLHGWESNTYRWRNLIKKLRENDFHILAFDAPSHGNSSGEQLYVPLYSECLQFFLKKYQPKAIAAHSMGGMTILYNQNQQKTPSIEKIITIGAPSEFEIIAKGFQQMLGFNKKVYNALDNYIIERFGFPISQFSSANWVKNNTIKGFVLHDEDDKIVSVDQAQLIHQNWKDSKTLITKGLGHSMHQDEVNDKIVAFLET